MDEFAKRAEELGHKLQRDEDGDINIFALDVGFHNGPECVRCGKAWCQHCTGVAGLKLCTAVEENDNVN